MIHQALSIGLPWPPSNNTYYRHVGHKTLLSRAGKDYRRAVLSLLACEADSCYPRTERLDVHIAVYPPDRRRRDLDNLPKGILDSLQHAGIYQDDEQIDKLTIERMEIRKGGEVIVTIVPRDAVA